MATREINKAAVIGAGTMGLGIAGQLANAGTEVVLLDLPADGANRNAIVERALERLLDRNQPGLTHRDNLKRITIGNTEDDFGLLSEVDWITEAVVERLDVKQDLYRKIDAVRKTGSIVSSNTSTIPIRLLVENMPASFREEFAITHYFNPVRYMQLLEIVRGEQTRDDVIETLEHFNDRCMGKGIVHCKDTPGFLGNRVGVFAIQSALHLAFRNGLAPEQADAVFGRPMGIPKTGVFGLYDLIGIDLMSDVVKSLVAILPPEDPFHDVAGEIPAMQRMIDEGLIGAKGGKGGFYRLRDPGDPGSRETLALDPFEYRPFDDDKPAVAVAAEASGDFTLLLDGDDEYSRYAWQVLSRTLSYAAALVPEVNESPVAIDDAMKLGYNWKHGPFEMLDAIGTDRFVERLKAENMAVPPFLHTACGSSFYRTDQGALRFLDAAGNFQALRRAPGIRRFSEERRTLDAILENESVSYFLLPEGFGLVEFHSKANTLDADSMQLLAEAIAHAGANARGLIVHNDAQHFSCGVNLQGVLDKIERSDWDGIDNFLDHFQQTVLKLRDATVPVIAAPSGLSLGGGFEVVLHCDRAVFHANSVTGLVESLVGVVPGGGGVKEMLHRWTEAHGDVTKGAWDAFMNIGYGRTARSPLEAEPLSMFRPGIDSYEMNRDRLLTAAIGCAEGMIEGYQASQRKPLAMPGREVFGEMCDWLDEAREAGKLTPHDATTGEAIAMIVTGGDIDAGALLSEQDLLALERKAFVNLAQTPQTKARVEHMLRHGTPLRN